MDHRERVAHHEAAHAVVALHTGFGLAEEGIDLDAPSLSVDGAFGNAKAFLADHDSALPPEVQKRDLSRNLQVILAGAASDARLLGILPREALARQPGDESTAVAMLEASPLVESKEEREHVLNGSLRLVVLLLDQPEVWAKVERVAQGCLAAGKLSKMEIERTYAEEGHSG